MGTLSYWPCESGYRAEAQDVTQEIFIHLVFGSFRDSKITTWLYTVTTRRCLNRIRNQKNRQALLTQNVHISNTNSFETTAVGRLVTLRLRIWPLSRYRYGDDMSRADIAQAMTSLNSSQQTHQTPEKKIQLLKQEGDAI